nr:ERI1 exoribonuclease 2 isoform X2 [Doryrhamphus excisus]XP_057924038.1 ERI1 exoribonuclease 2 isoform X2 [Doryrhamphus excisus]XP_057924046.1 ERI1 exoribonuclease 2 isoform X2 [Doryrhamphus excisus]XP_057924054.1 ERI1 exoribonuclease 2 isoform X2 [Doryrhamphus excisus]XP_057924063.1 ERI1 exoribonuclease 2 isoform X2 [Doryrhamphus excisus]XP_057924071.1 ERI1 exoribonuclease 2 isoform X2 [Doryrhamphus excisus]XP_057924077.1 ERI1 exoribonuclease 2 isoform X2 [Doryrhamphus excisus]XP_05792408
MLRQRSQSSAVRKTLLSNQVFAYLIVIDFESTCWREKRNSTQEIIEFPAVLLNASTGEIESEFHTYVQPQEHPVLSAFCTELTGITQVQVEAGVPLQICLSQFNRWLQTLRLEKALVFPGRQDAASAPPPSSKLCAFLTWSDWDLGVCLHYECKRKQIHKPDVVNSWIDLRSTYRMFYSRKPKGLNGALQDLGIQFCGREHSGLDDARNTAQLAARMMRDGCVMKITRSLVREDKPKKPATSTPSSVANATKVLNLQDNSSPRVSVPVRQSLVSPKTLLNGTPSPLCGLWSRTRCATAVDSSNNLILCSTVMGSLQHQQARRSGPTGLGEEHIEELAVEAEDRCGSYDDVVLDDIVMDPEGTLEAISDYYSAWGEPVGPPGDTAVCQDVPDGQNPGFAVLQTASKQQQAASAHKINKTTSSFRTFVPDRSSTPDASIFRPKGGIASSTSSFTALTDSRKKVAASASFNVPKTVLSLRPANVVPSGTAKITPPLCGCGRRSRRLQVSNGGPNHGRGFYCCAARQTARKGCKFFKWESTLKKTSSVLLCHADTMLGPRRPQRKSV